MISKGLWFAWKFLSLWYQTQLVQISSLLFIGCDLLENFYLCGIKHNFPLSVLPFQLVVICLKISIFVVSNTTYFVMLLAKTQLWFAWKFLSLWYQTQPIAFPPFIRARCDLLENFYLCGIKHNWYTSLWCIIGLWFAWKFLSLWYQTQPIGLWN